METVKFMMNETEYVNYGIMADMLIDDIEKADVIYIHDGEVNADDIFSAALIESTLASPVDIKRTKNVRYNDSSYLTSKVGGGPFYHCSEVMYRNVESKSGIFGLFGKLWLIFGPMLIDQKVCDFCLPYRLSISSRIKIWQSIDMNLVQPIDYTGNTGIMNPLSYLINLDKLNEEFDTLVCKARDYLFKAVEFEINKLL